MANARSSSARPGTARFLIGAVIGAVGIAVGARIVIPLDPVPLTLQTLFVVLAGGIGGPRIGAAAAVIYAVAVALGAPILADGRAAGGAEFLELPSAGYVVAFVPAAAVAGPGSRSVVSCLARAVAAHAVVLVVGAAWLARTIGIQPAVEHGVRPFVVGAILKSVVAALIVAALNGWRPGRR
ncbi:MAG: biotin transporter BioY [Planctomycetota bacterium]